MRTSTEESNKLHAEALAVAEANKKKVRVFDSQRRPIKKGSINHKSGHGN